MLLVCMLFKTDCLTLDNYLVCSSLGNSTSPTPSSPQLSTVLPIGLRLQGLFPVQLAVHWCHPCSAHIQLVMSERHYSNPSQGCKAVSKTSPERGAQLYKAGAETHFESVSCEPW